APPVEVLKPPALRPHPGEIAEIEDALAVDRGELEHVIVHVDRKRIFNLGYFTWVEQQGVSLEDFERRRGQRFWQDLAASVPVWDRLIGEFNDEIAATRSRPIARAQRA